MLSFAEVEIFAACKAPTSGGHAARARGRTLCRAAALFFLALFALALIPSLSSAAIFKCISQDGSVTYTDEPCPTGAMTQNIDTAARWPGESPPMNTAPAFRDTKSQSQPETIAMLCANDEFRVWLKAQRHSLPEPDVRTTKFIEISHLCRRALHLPDEAGPLATAAGSRG